MIKYIIKYFKMKKKQLEFKTLFYTYGAELLSGFIALNYERALKNQEKKTEN